ncbi:hypothetical protein KM043_005532 [Ampulex compressa]|nr:hypothetical protein KM043_005532 [Ampulex compressa]
MVIDDADAIILLTDICVRIQSPNADAPMLQPESFNNIIMAMRLHGCQPMPQNAESTVHAARKRGRNAIYAPAHRGLQISVIDSAPVYDNRAIFYRPQAVPVPVSFRIIIPALQPTRISVTKAGISLNVG